MNTTVGQERGGIGRLEGYCTCRSGEENEYNCRSWLRRSGEEYCRSGKRTNRSGEVEE